MSVSQVLAPFNNAGSIVEGSAMLEVKAMMQHETPIGLALVRQLVSALHVCSARLKSVEDLPPRAAALRMGATFSKGHSDAVLSIASLLMLIVPALRNPPKDKGAAISFETP